MTPFIWNSRKYKWMYSDKKYCSLGDGGGGRKDYNRGPSKLRGLMKLCYLDYGNVPNVLKSKSSEHTLQMVVKVCLKRTETKCSVVSSSLINSELPSIRRNVLWFFHKESGWLFLYTFCLGISLICAIYLRTFLFFFFSFVVCLGVFKIFLIHHHYNSL